MIPEPPPTTRVIACDPGAALIHPISRVAA